MRIQRLFDLRIGVAIGREQRNQGQHSHPSAHLSNKLLLAQPCCLNRLAEQLGAEFLVGTLKLGRIHHHLFDLFVGYADAQPAAGLFKIGLFDQSLEHPVAVGVSACLRRVAQRFFQIAAGNGLVAYFHNIVAAAGELGAGKAQPDYKRSGNQTEQNLYEGAVFFDGMEHGKIRGSLKNRLEKGAHFNPFLSNSDNLYYNPPFPTNRGTLMKTLPAAMAAALLLAAAVVQAAPRSEAEVHAYRTTMKSASEDLKGGRPAAAFGKIRKMAEKGYPEAQYILGTLYHDGEGTKQDLAAARRWYDRAAAQKENENISKLAREALEELN